MGKVLELIDLSYHSFNMINISFEEKTFYSIVGPNNCGKTTLFKLIAGFLPSDDSIYYLDTCLDPGNIRKYITNFGVIERVNRNSFIYKSVVDEMIYPLHNLGYSKKSSLERIKNVLNMFDAIDYLDKDINTLNYYEKQLLIIMISLLHKPKILLFDSVLETFPNTMKDQILDILKKLVHDGMTIINFSSSLEEAYCSDKIFLMDNYKIVGEYTKDDIYNDDKLFYEHNLEIPFMTDLSVKLKMYNLIDKEYSDMKAMVDDIWP